MIISWFTSLVIIVHNSGVHLLHSMHFFHLNRTICSMDSHSDWSTPILQYDRSWQRMRVLVWPKDIAVPWPIPTSQGEQYRQWKYVNTRTVHTSSFQGYWCYMAHFISSRWPFLAARLHVRSSRGHCCVLAQCNIFNTTVISSEGITLSTSSV